MEPSAVVRGLDEVSDGGAGMGEIAIGAGVDLLVLERLHEALGHGVIVGTAGPAHAGLDPGRFEAGNVVTASVLGGFKLSLQQLEEGGSNNMSAAFGSGFAGEAEITWASGCGAARGPTTVLGVDRRRLVERGRGDGGGDIAASWNTLVPDGRRASAVTPITLVEAALRPLLAVCRTGGDRAVAGAGFGRAGGRSLFGPISVHGVPETAA